MDAHVFPHRPPHLTQSRKFCKGEQFKIASVLDDHGNFNGLEGTFLQESCEEVVEFTSSKFSHDDLSVAYECF